MRRLWSAPNVEAPAAHDASAEPRGVLLRFAVYTAVALAASAGGILWFVRSEATSRSERAVAFHARFVADTILRDRLRPSDFAAPVAGARRAALDALFRKEVLVEGARRVRLFSPAGVLTYSNDRATAGAHGLPGVREALSGRTVHDIGRLGGRAGSRSGAKVLDAYVPVRFAGPARPAGVFAFSQDYGPVARDVRDAVLPVAAALGLALAVLWVLLIPLLHRVTVALRRRNERLSDQAKTLGESERRYRSLFENASDVVATFDSEGRCVSINGAGVRLSGYGREELIGATFSKLVTLQDAERLREKLSRLRPEETVSFELELIARSGERVALEASARIAVENGLPAGIEVIARDVGERRRLEERLRQSQKMDAIGRLAGGVAHDFNNLLFVIRGYSSLLLGRLPDGGREREHVAEIDAAAERAAALTGQLLAFSRMQVVQPQAVDVNAIVADTEKMLRRLIGEDIEFVAVLEEGLGCVRADSGQIVQVLLNLAVNARDAMAAGGRLRIETRRVDLDEGAARRLHGARPGPYALLTVADTGIGMDPSTRSRLFEPFFTTKERGKGTGLGLSTVYGIVTQSGGHISVSSEPGRGTTFEIHLPLLIDACVPAAAPEDAPAMAGGAETILLVEDEDAVRRLVRGILEQHGYHVLEARHGEEALGLSREHEGPIELVLTDVVMPVMGGPELVARLAEARPEADVLFMSGYVERPLDPTGLEHAVPERFRLDVSRNFLQKPFPDRRLVEKVRAVLDARVAATSPDKRSRDGRIGLVGEVA